ncbi:outer membrane protein assembly factor BamB [Rhodococcus sp. SRB_17]|uniref:outer membrane protein assembly factor BamB n=1 Tax=Acidovorax sp. SRB_24 TaxID=1962700 RepID=UPI00145DE064|nr:outer membrane protein assembly factor BamB [Acidovorax sp. SRB_24]NMM77846.1 outer membrane protein assembly factor BamB [Acidovorax sp. SRB_24]NMM89450.1 outer membrane protein assembly factor BamB [Rhodococcus sp. SRB_17]
MARHHRGWHAWRRSLLLTMLLTGLTGCSLWGGGASRPQPAELGPNVPVLGVRQAWSAHLGSATGAPLVPHVQETTVTLAGADGTLVAIDARTGAEVWRTHIDGALAAGIGSDGRWTAVVSRNNDVVVLDEGREQWRQRVAAQTYTPPLVAGGRVFVLAADRTVMAFDAQTGQRLWSQARPGEPLVLRQPGVLIAVKDTLVAGLSGRLVGLSPDTGAVRWEAPLASPRGTNDVERLVELVAPISRVGESVCARAFQAAVGCVDTDRAAVLWTQKSNGSEGLDGDSAALYGVESDGTVTSWRRADGRRAWSSLRLQYRKLTAPLLLGRSVVIGDDTGLVHLLSREDGTPLNRLSTDGSGIAATPVAVADTLIVVTRKGSVYGFRPD